MSFDMDHSVALNILHNYFKSTTSLRTYLERTLSPGPSVASIPVLVSPNDDHLFRQLLETTYVASETSKDSIPWNPDFSLDMVDIIDQAQVLLLTRKNQYQTHVITQGYRLANGNGEGVTLSGRLNNFFVNTIITALQRPEWVLLLRRIGIDAMIHLLTKTSIFAALPNGCLCQMTGPLLLNTVTQTECDRLLEATSKRKRTSADSESSERLQKRIKVGSIARFARPSVKMRTRSPVDVPFARQRMFYARPNFTRSKTIVVGLPQSHILNRLDLLSGPRAKDPAKVEPHIQAEQSRRLAKYIFPRQYGLANAFMFEVSKWEPSYIPDFADREAEIQRLGSCKTPKRLKDTLPVLEKLIWRHGKCKYQLLRDKACPSKITPQLLENDVDGSSILEMMSEYSSQLQSQKSLNLDSFDSEGKTIAPFGLTQARQHIRNKPRFMDFACHHNEVYRFVVLVTDAVIPKRFWGTKANFKLVCQHIRNFIVCRRYETLSLHHVLQGFSTSGCEWLMPAGDGKNQMRVSVSDALKRRELLEDFMFWFFDSFVISLLRTTFYITDTSALRNQVLYFRLDDWERLCEPLIGRLTCGTFEKISQDEAKETLKQRQLGFSFVRLLPKETGVRPIVNLRRKQISKPGLPHNHRSINQILQAAFQILKHEKEIHPHLLGASTSGNDDVYSKLKSFKLSLRDSGGRIPKLYFVKMDVQACFDTIDQQRLLEILRSLISEDNYMIQRFGQVSMSVNRPRRTYLKKAIPENDHPHFLQCALDLATSLRNIIFVDQVTYPPAKVESVLELLEQHITENIVKIGDDYYRQVVGIPQGSVISSLLCSFFYGDLERQPDFPSFSDDPQSLLMRHTDDYLLITADLAKAKQFLRVMNKGHPEYGCFVSKEKTVTNFDLDYDEQVIGVTSPLKDSFPWCGYAINMTDLSVAVDYDRYGNSHLSNTLTIGRGRFSGRAFLNKMLLLAKSRSHVIYTDSMLNSEHTIHLNIYQNFLLSAMKLDAYVRDWDGKKRSETDRFIKHTTDQMFCYCFSAMRGKALNRIGKVNKSLVRVQKADILWLGAHAFHKVLSRRPQRYRSLLRALAFDMERGRNHNRRQRFRKVLKDGFARLEHIF